MNVRDEPVTLWTIEMLPATRFGSCARKSVGRRSLERRSLRNDAGVGGGLQAVEDGGIGRHVALAAVGGNNGVRVRKDVEIAGDAGVGEREARGIGAEPLPRLHLPLVRFLRNLRVEVERHHRVDAERRREREVDFWFRRLIRPAPASGRRDLRRDWRRGRCR